MRPLPVVERELRAASRRPSTYRRRWIAALIAFIFAGYFFWVFSRFGSSKGLGRETFLMLTQFMFFYCLFIGAGTTADCLSSEKREGTLGFLFLTELQSYDIVFGKLLASSVQSIFNLVATLPALGLCLLLGGVQSIECFRMSLALADTLFFSLATGILVSALCQQERKAVHIVSTIVAIWGFALPLIGEWLRRKTSAFSLGIGLQMFSPVYLLNFSTLPTASVRYFWWSLLLIHLISWILLAAACFIVRTSWQDRVQTVRKPGWRNRFRTMLLGSPARRLRMRQARLNKNAFYWLASRSPVIAVETWIIFGAILVLAAASAWFFRDVLPVFVLCVMTAVLFHAIAKGQLCAAVCDRLAEDKHSASLELLLATPLSVKGILHGQWLALLRQLGPLFATVIVLDFVLLGIALLANEPEFFREPSMLRHCLWACAGAGLMLAADGVTIGWVGMWQALSANNVMAARSRTLSSVLFVPWIILVLILTWSAFSASNNPWMRDLEFEHFLGVWFLVGILTNAFFAATARRKLYSAFRLMATERYQPQQPRKLGWWAVFHHQARA